MTTLLKSSILTLAGVVPAGVPVSTMAAYAIVALKIPWPGPLRRAAADPGPAV